MASTRARKSCSSILGLAILLATSTPGCVIGRVYVGSEIQADLQDRITVGATTKGEILVLCGPPDTVRRQYDGDVFVYRYLRRNFSTLDIVEPVFTRLTTLCANMNETLPPSEFRVEGGEE